MNHKNTAIGLTNYSRTTADYEAVCGTIEFNLKYAEQAGILKALKIATEARDRHLTPHYAQTIVDAIQMLIEPCQECLGKGCDTCKSLNQ